MKRRDENLLDSTILQESCREKEDSVLEKKPLCTDGRGNEFFFPLNIHNCARKRNASNLTTSLEELCVCLMETSNLIDRVLDEIQPDFYQKYCVLRGALEEIQRILEKALKEDED